MSRLNGYITFDLTGTCRECGQVTQGMAAANGLILCANCMGPITGADESHSGGLCYTFTLDELRDRLPFDPGDTIVTVAFVRMTGQMANRIQCGVATKGYTEPNSYPQATANLWERLLGLDGAIVGIAQSGDRVTITTDAQAPF